MIIVSQKSETRLLQALQDNRKERQGQKCFHLRFSKTKALRDDVFEKFTQRVEGLPDSYLAQSYVCQDTDIFILMHEFMQRQFLSLAQEISGTIVSDSSSNIIDVYDMGADRDVIIALVEKKISALEMLVDKSDLGQDENSAHITQALSNIDPLQIASLPSRRKNRDYPIILVIDDDQLSRTLVNNVLQNDYRLVFSENGKSGIKSYVEHAPDVLFLDIGLPDILGSDLLELFFQIDPENYTIMFSGQRSEDNIYGALRQGAQGFVEKPFSREKMIRYVEESPYIKSKQESGSSPMKQSTK